MSAAETLRRLVRAVLEHHDGHLNDDATVLLCEWHGGARTAPSVPEEGASGAKSAVSAA